MCAAAGSVNSWEARTNTRQNHCWFHTSPALLHSQNEGPDISRLRPDLQQQWDESKNLHFGKTQIYPCQVSKSTSLATKAPDVAKEWDYEANKLTPDDYTAGSQVRVHWKCQTCGQGWTASVQQSTGSASRQGTGCPHCYSLRRGHKADGSRQNHGVLADSGHPVMHDWDTEMNAKLGLDPMKTKLCSRKRVYWVCRKCPMGQLHRWAARPSNRIVYNKGCPCCSGHKVCQCNSLRTRFPEIAKDWDYAANEGTPDDYSAFSGKEVWWKSAARGSWQQSINQRSIAYRKRQRARQLRREHHE